MKASELIAKLRVIPGDPTIIIANINQPKSVLFEEVENIRVINYDVTMIE
jgi:hypothetical protein